MLALSIRHPLSGDGICAGLVGGIAQFVPLANVYNLNRANVQQL